MSAKDGNLRKRPLFSIVIANYNYGHFLEEAIKSVITQSCQNFELIIVDGGSTDSSVEIIRRYVGDLPPNTRIEDFHLQHSTSSSKISWWCSEKDNGQSDAFNKGFAHARGQFGCWLNADDILLPGTIKAVLREIEQTSGIEWIAGGVIYCDAELTVQTMRIGCSVPSRFHEWFSMTVIGGPSSFFSLSRLKEVGGFDVTLHYIMDGDLWKRFFEAGVKLAHINHYMWGFRLHEQSKTASNIVTRRMPKGQVEECQRLTIRDAVPRYKVIIGSILLKVWKIASGSLVRSVLDTYKYRGRKVTDIS